MRGASLAIVTAGFLAASLPGAAPSSGPATVGEDLAGPGGTGLPTAPRSLPTFTVLDAGFNTGFYTDLVLDDEDRPVLTYYDDTASALVLLRCHDPDCRARTRTVVDEEGHTGLFTSVALDGDLPVISYYDLSAHAVRLARCEDPDCQTVTRTTVTTDAPELTSTAVSLDAGGRAVLAYRAGDDSGLWLAHCPDRRCVSPTTVRLDGAGVDEAIALDVVGDAVAVAYRRDGLQLASCRLPCDVPAIESLDPDPGAGFYPSVLSGPDGLPVVGHLDFGAKEVEVIRCWDHRCVRREAIIVEAAPLSGFFATPVLDPSGRLQVGFFDEAIEGLVLVTCTTRDCHDRLRDIVDPTPLAGQHLAMASGDRGLTIAYHDGSVRNLRLVRCPDGNCYLPPEKAGPPGRGIAAAEGPTGPVIVYRASPRAGVRIVRCLDRACRRASATAADDLATLTGAPDVATVIAGSPVVAFQDLATEQLRLTLCADRRCPYLEGTVLADVGSVGHVPRIVTTTSGPAVVHRDETRRQVELIVCASETCSDPARVPVTATEGRGGALAVAAADGQLIVAYHDDRSGRLEVRVCTPDGCGEASTLAPASLPEPLALEAQVVAAGLQVAVVHRDAGHLGLELLVCGVPCADPDVTPLPAGSRHPSLAWDREHVYVVHGLGDRTVLTVCGDDGCEAAQEVLPRVGPTTILTGQDGRALVGVLPPADGAPALAACDDRGCAPVVPEVVPIP